MIRYKEVKLFPTDFSLDVYIVGDRYNRNRISKKDKESLSRIFVKMYGGNYEMYYEDMDVNCVFDTLTTKGSIANGDRRITMTINPVKTTLVHEIIHVLWFLAKITHLDMDYNSQEWQAHFCEYIYREVKDFKKIPIFETKNT